MLFRSSAWFYVAFLGYIAAYIQLPITEALLDLSVKNAGVIVNGLMWLVDVVTVVLFVLFVLYSFNLTTKISIESIVTYFISGFILGNFIVHLFHGVMFSSSAVVQILTASLMCCYYKFFSARYA